MKLFIGMVLVLALFVDVGAFEPEADCIGEVYSIVVSGDNWDYLLVVSGGDERVLEMVWREDGEDEYVISVPSQHLDAWSIVLCTADKSISKMAANYSVVRKIRPGHGMGLARGGTDGRGVVQRLIVVPNPGNPGVSMRISSHHEIVELGVYDVRGRRIAELNPEGGKTSSKVFYWDGRCGDGRAAPAGVYYVTDETRTNTGSVALVK